MGTCSGPVVQVSESLFLQLFGLKQFGLVLETILFVVRLWEKRYKRFWKRPDHSWERMAYKCKRLRGWELEKESGMLQRKALGKATEPERESQLATKLLSLWAHGMLSAILVRELADLALQDKADHVELVALAKTGDWGSQKGNAHKQIMRRFCKNITLPDPFHVSASCIDPKTSKETKEDAAIFLPHLVFAGLGKDHPEFFQQMCHLGKGELEEFLGRCQSH